MRQAQIPKAGQAGEFRTLGIPAIYNRLCQPVFDDANFGYRRVRFSA